jgi:SAM-dependent methyltransferase
MICYAIFLMFEHPLMTSHLSLAHMQWQRRLRPGDNAIDATCGRGKDTLCLAQLIGPTGTLIGIDLQEEAIIATRQRLAASLAGEYLDRIHLFQQSHAQFPRLAHDIPISLIAYNLGYLPQGDPTLTTMTSTTLKSIREAMDLIRPQGLICITCYPGHPEGKVEEQALLQLTANLPQSWRVDFYRKSESMTAPSLFLIEKQS